MNNELATNTTLSHYRIVSKIGEGGMGEVWLAEDTRLGRKVALKLLPVEFTEDSERVRRFTQEAKAASALNHPNIISVYDIGESETGRFIVMEFVAGHTLRLVIAKDNSLETFFTLGAQMAKALSAAHAAGITHRDIKPDNIMVRDDGYVKVLDFGLARLLPTTSSDPEAATLAQQTTPGTVMGTLAYMSPEQSSGQTAGSGSDVFALGIVLYELATGHHPFKSETMIGYLHAITSQVPPSMRSIKSDFPPALDDLILRMLEKDVRQRPTAGEVAQALQEIEKYGSSNTLPFRVAADKPRATREEEGFWVAVLPFKYRGNNADLEALAEGLSEDIVTGLSRFSYLHVIARGSTLRYANQTADLRTVGKELAARYVMEGTLRQAGTKLRLAVQLVDATTGAHLWAENYEREFRSENIFELQDDLVPRIVSTVADWYGVLPHSMSEIVRLKPPDQLSPYEALLRSFGYFENIAPDEHAIVRASLERAVAQEPGNADVWAMLSMLFGEEHRFGFNVKPDSLGRSLEAARKAVAIAHANHFAWLALAQALFFSKEFDPFRDAAERAIVLNAMDGSTVEYLGHLIAFSGNWERGCELAERARQLNPNHPSWYWSVPFLNAYRKGDYRGARPFLMKGNPQKNYLMHALFAAVNGQLGESEAAARHLREVLTMMPDFPSTGRDEFSKWYLPELVDHLMDGLRKAGLEVTDEDSTSTSSVPSLPSSETRAAEGFWVAVLPFKSSGTATELKSLAEGLSEDIVTGLSRFSYLRVIARNSTLDYDGNSSEVKTIGQTLGARYVMEGSLRQSGTKLRLAVQLVDTTTGVHLWAENYERTFSPETIFELQDDLVPRIVSTVADQYGALVHSMSESLRGRSASQYSAHEAMLRLFGYLERMTPEEHSEVRGILEAAVAAAPGHSGCHAALSTIYWQEYANAYNVRPDPLGRARAAARQAVAVGPTNHLAHSNLATVLFFQKDFLAFRPVAERGLALNIMDTSTTALLGTLIAYAGDWDYGLAVIERAAQLNPHLPGWYLFPAFHYAYHRQDYRGALASALKFNMPGYFFTHAALAAVYGQLGEQEHARAALRELHALIPKFGAIAREEFGKWLDSELTEHLLDGLRKAGLEIPDEDRRLDTSPALDVSSERRADEGFWVAVLPFKATGTNTELSTLAEGLSDEIITGLNRFSYLRVIARSSTLQYASQTSDVRSVGKSLGARYVMEGNLRQAGTKMRLAVQLVDTTTGAHLWAENYERPFSPESIFELQDELVPRVVSTIADSHGVLPRSMSEAVQSRTPEELSPYEAVLRSFNYTRNVTSAALSDSVFCLELAVQKAPAYADAWAMLGVTLVQDYAQGYNLRADSLSQAEGAARRAVELASSNHLAWASLARVHFFQREKQSFRNAVERSVALNTMDGDSHASLGEMLTFSGDADRGLELVERAKQLNPDHPGWYWYANFYQAYKQCDYRAALNFALKVNLPGHWAQPMFVAVASGQLGETEAAAKALGELLKLRPDVSNTARKDFVKWWNDDDVEHLLEGLRKAGLEIDGMTEGDVIASPTHPFNLSHSGSSGSFIKSIAVLPFQNLSVDPEQEFFADGITEEILNALAQIKELRVTGRSSSCSFKGRNEDLRSVGAKLNVSSILEGTLRRSGDRLRITAQLIDAVSGYQLWSERYDRVLEDTFDVQDEIALAVVDALKLKLFGDAKEAVVKRYTDDTEVHELFLKGRYYSYKYTAEGWTRAVEFFEKVIEKDPDHAPAHAGIAASVGCLWFFGLSPADETVPQFRSAAIKAIELDGNLAGAHLSLAMVNFFHDWEWEKAEEEFKQAILLNPKDAEALSYYAMFLGFVDRVDEAMTLARRALEVDPLSLLINMNVGWTYFSAGPANEAFDQARKMTEIEPAFFGAYWLKGSICLENADYEGAIEQLTKAVSLGAHPIVLADLGAAYALAEKKETAETILEQLLEMRRQSYVPAICLARVYSRLGELEMTIQWLETAYEERNGELVFLESEITSAAQGDSLNSLGKDPRVKDLLERMKLPSRDRGE